MGLEKGCPCCKVYKDDLQFKKVMQLERAGLVIYRHTTPLNSVASVSQPEKAYNINDNVFIIHNTKSSNVSTSNYMSEFEQAITCPRCRYIVKHTKELLLNVPTIRKKDVIGICDHCRFKKQMNERCNKCQLVVQEFLKRQDQQQTERRGFDKKDKVLTSKIKHILKDAPKAVYRKSKTQLHSEISLKENLSYKTSPKYHEPRVKDMFEIKKETDKNKQHLKTKQKGFLGQIVIPKLHKNKSDSEITFTKAKRRHQHHEPKKNILFKSAENIAWPESLNESAEFIELDEKHQHRLRQKVKPKIELDLERLPSTDLEEYLKKENHIFRPINYETQKWPSEKSDIHEKEDSKKRKKDQHSYDDIHHAKYEEVPKSAQNVEDIFLRDIQKQSRSFHNIRRHSSEETILRSASATTEPKLHKDFSYCFIKETDVVKKPPRRHASSSELIKDTQDMYRARAEEERIKKEQELKEKLEAEEKKHLAKIERMRYQEEKRRLEELKKKKAEEERRLEDLKKKKAEEDQDSNKKKHSKQETESPKRSVKASKETSEKSKSIKLKTELKESKIDKSLKSERDSLKSKKELNKQDKEESMRLEKERKLKEKSEKEDQIRKANEVKQKQKEDKEKEKANKEEQMRLGKEKKQRQKEDKEKEKANKEEQMRLGKEEKQRQIKEKDKEKANKEEQVRKAKEEKQKEKEERDKEKANKEEQMRKANKEEQMRKAKEEKETEKEGKDKEKANKEEQMRKAKEEIRKEKEEKDKEKANKEEQMRKAKEEKQKEKEEREKQEAQLRIDKEQQQREKDERLRAKEDRQKEKEQIRLQAEENKKARKDNEKNEENLKNKQLEQQLIDQQKDKESKLRKKQEDEAKKKEAQLKLKSLRETKAEEPPEEPQDKKNTEESKIKDLNINQIKIRKNTPDDLILQLVRLKQTKGGLKERPTRMSQINIPNKILYDHMGHKNIKRDNCIICLDSDLELDIENIRMNETKTEEINDIIIGQKIFKYKHALVPKKEDKETKPALFNCTYTEGEDNIVSKQEQKGNIAKEKEKYPPIFSAKYVEQEVPKGIIRYALSDRTFIDKGWTMLPTEKVVRKMNVYRMRPAHPEFDWFEHNKSRKLICYDTGEKLAEFDDNGRGRWFYRSGKVALDYYDTEEINALHRIIIFSSGEPDDRGCSRPLAILATFDYLGNGIVFDHSGKIRLKYNQTEGVVLDRSIGPVSHWKWHTLNDPPVLQQVMIDTQMAHKDPEILKLGGPHDDKPRPDNEEMLAIEFDNFIKEKSKKLSQKFKPFQIKMKALKINEYFSLKVLDQATIYLIYRDGTTNLKLNIGMILDHQEIVDTDTAELGEVSNSLERFPAKTDSLAGLQKSVAHAQRVERVRVERTQRLRPAQPCASADRLVAGLARPPRPPPPGHGSCQCRKPPSFKLYYDTRLI